MQQTRCVIVSAAPLAASMKKLLRPGDYLIACDGGYRSTRQLLEREPDVILGDFDSAPEPEGSGAVVLPRVKDDTDTHYAAKLAVEKGFSQVLMLGALGGHRLEHTLANIGTGLWLAKQGKQVTIVEALDKLLAVNGPLCHANSEMLEALIPYNNIQVVTSAKVQHFENGVLTAQTPEGECKLEADDVILCVGYKEEDSLYKELEFAVPELYFLGDARKVANIMYAIWDAFEVANHI